MYDVVIAGAGPAGTACALALSSTPGLRVALLDKARAFPRDKVCGDAIPGAAAREVARLAECLGLDLSPPDTRAGIRHARFYGDDPAPLELTWVVPAYNATRERYDAHLYRAVERHTATDIHLGATVRQVERHADRLTVVTTAGDVDARLLIGCDGANSAVARALTDTRLERRHHLAAVRAYYRGVRGAAPDTNDVYFPRRWQPGYLWVFPVGDGLYNVGIGMSSAAISARRVNLAAALDEAIAEHPALRARFAGAEQVGRTVGFGLPTGSRAVQCHGDRFLLCGDAAALIDPIGGHGIDTAIRSGVLAAETAVVGLRQNRLDAAALAPYAEALAREIRPKLRRHGYLMRLGGHAPWLFDLGTRLARVPALKRLAHRYM